MMTDNTNLNKANKVKNDEFYTLLYDIEKELVHYTDYFADKIVYCNCDDPNFSNFYLYFTENFEKLKLKKFITTCYKTRQQDLFGKVVIAPAVCTITHSIGKTERYNLQGDGDFRSAECQEILKQADIIVTNPPFSLFRDYMAQLVKFEKKFLIIGNLNAVTYVNVFPLFRDSKMRCGYTSGSKQFICGRNDNTVIADKSMTTNVCWYTNLNLDREMNTHINCTKKYNAKDYPQYTNYNAIEVSKLADIPIDYDGVMGVPVSFIPMYNPDQFVLLGHDHDRKRDMADEVLTGKRLINAGRTCINGQEMFARIFIKHKKNGVVVIGDDEKRGGYFAP